MDLSNIKLSPEMNEILDVLFIKARHHNPELDETKFMERIIGEWLEPYKWHRDSTPPSKKNVVLRNRIKDALKLAGKTQTEVAEEIGIDRTYLGHIIRGKYEPSIKLGLILSSLLGYLINDLFYLEPAPEE